MATLRFMALMKIYAVNPYVLVSAERASKLKRRWRKPMPVLVRINSRPETPWRINMMPIGDGSFRLYLHGEVRKASHTRVGDRVKIEVRFDARYKRGPSHAMPAWFRTALRKSPSAKKNWDVLVPSRKKEILRYFSRLRSSEACKRNLVQAVHVLSGKPGRFLARSWVGGK
jgi:hypothetical protein